MHGHIQISYENAESLEGFDPRKKEDIEFAHKLLDEYLEKLGEAMTKAEAAGLKEGREPTTDSDAGFHVWPWFDSH